MFCRSERSIMAVDDRDHGESLRRENGDLIRRAMQPGEDADAIAGGCLPATFVGNCMATARALGGSWNTHATALPD